MDSWLTAFFIFIRVTDLCFWPLVGVNSQWAMVRSWLMVIAMDLTTAVSRVRWCDSQLPHSFWFDRIFESWNRKTHVIFYILDPQLDYHFNIFLSMLRRLDIRHMTISSQSEGITINSTHTTVLHAELRKLKLIKSKLGAEERILNA